MIAISLLLLSQAAPARPAPSPDELMQKVDAAAGLKERDKPFEIAASLGRLYFTQGRYPEAKTFFEQALRASEPTRASWLSQRKTVGAKALPSAASVGCEEKPDNTLAVLTTKAQALLAAKNGPGALACLKVAVAPLPELEVALGTSQFLSGDAPAALATYTRSLEAFETNAEARYSRGAATLDALGDDLPALARAQADLQRYLVDAPNAPHAVNAKRLLARTSAAIAAGGLSKLAVTADQVAAVAPKPLPGTAPVLTKEVMEAFQNAPRTPEMETNFAKLVSDAEEHLARGRFQDALTAYKQVMPYQPDNARLRAGMAWTMIRLNRQPMADNVWRVATQSPAAIVELGDALKAKGDEAGAKAVWQRLKDSVPEYAPKLEGKL